MAMSAITNCEGSFFAKLFTEATEARMSSLMMRIGALPGSLRHPVGGRDPQEGDDEDADNSFGGVGLGRVGGRRASANAMQCCARCGVKTWRCSRGRWA